MMSYVLYAKIYNVKRVKEERRTKNITNRENLTPGI